MGLKKYEIITVGSDKRVRALRSWQVQDRYVNIGDVGGIVYDEKTLSQDGACWLFRGNFGFPGARIGGDSIVDVGETTLGATGAPAVDILGTSTVVGAPVRFSSERTAADAVTLTAADFEQGGFNYAAGVNWETMKAASGSYIRSKALIFSGGAPVTVKCAVGGYAVTWYTTDADGITTGAAASQIVTGAGVSFTVPAGQYFFIRIRKEPTGTIVPADATAAQLTFTGTYETKLSVVDSRVEINPATSTGTTTIRPGGTYAISPGSKYPDSVIQNSKVTVNSNATAERVIRLMTELVNVNATIYATTENAQAVGIHHGVNNLTFTGQATPNQDEAARSLIQAYNCDNMVVNSTNFPGLADAQTANMPFIFQGCNVPNGRFYHHAQIANTYKNIDFALASVDLGKATANVNVVLVSSDVEGMYRVYHKVTNLWGPLVESLDSVISLKFLGGNPSNGYATTIYKDAYFNGEFDFAGTNVFGNTKKHDAGNTQDISGVLVKGLFNATTNGSTISGVVANNARAVVSQPFRVSGAGGVSVSSPAGVECNIYLTDAANTILVNTGYVSGTNAPIVPALPAVYAYVAMRKTNGSDILSMDEFKGVTVTVYNGCKIINTKAAAATIAGNVRVEDNATLIDTRVTGTGYFGGNSIAQGLTVVGVAYMKDNAVFAPTISGTPNANILHMTDNASFTGAWAGAGTRLVMSGNTRFDSATGHNTLGIVKMRDNASVSGSGAVYVSGVLVLEDDASITGGSASIFGDITLCGKYKQTAGKTWTGKRVIASQGAPTYDNNVKTQYDF